MGNYHFYQSNVYRHLLLFLKFDSWLINPTQESGEHEGNKTINQIYINQNETKQQSDYFVLNQMNQHMRFVFYMM